MLTHQFTKTVQLNLVEKTIPYKGYGDAIDYLQNEKFVFRRDFFPLFLKSKLCFPIIETNFTAWQSRHDVCSIVGDSLFFELTDRKLAFELVDKETKQDLKNIGFLYMSDDDLLNFMCKRLIEKEKIYKSIESKNKPLAKKGQRQYYKY
jgi:hypothetical protein